MRRSYSLDYYQYIMDITYYHMIECKEYDLGKVLLHFNMRLKLGIVPLNLASALF
jgi:hypothetical protein